MTKRDTKKPPPQLAGRPRAATGSVEAAMTLRMPPELKRLAEAAAAKEGVPLTHWIRQAMTARLYPEKT